jgi:hypothetical protein
MSNYHLWRESVPAHQATSTQRRLAQEHIERMKRWRVGIKEPEPVPEPVAPPPPLAPEPVFPVPQVPDVLPVEICPPRYLSVRLIIEIVAAEYNMTRDILLSRQRRHFIVRPRQIAIYLALDMLRGVSLGNIGRWFGGFDHTTILHAKNKIKSMIAAEERVAIEIEAVRQKVIAASLIVEANDN